MTTPVLVLDADTPADVATRQLALGVAGAVVRHRGQVVGVVTPEDVLARSLPGRPVPQLPGPFLRHGRLLATLRVWQLMRAGPLGVAADQPLVEAARVMDDQHQDVLVVVDGHGQPVGIITARRPDPGPGPAGPPRGTSRSRRQGGSCRCSWPPVS